MLPEKAVRNIRAQHKQRIPSFLGHLIFWGVPVQVLLDVSTKVLWDVPSKGLWGVPTQVLWDGRTQLPRISLEVALCF